MILFFWRNRSIQTKMIFICIAILAIPLLILGRVNFSISSNQLSELGETNLQNSVAVTLEFMDALNDEVKRGTLTLDEAQEKVKVAILGEKQEDGTRSMDSAIDLGEDGYFFIADVYGNIVAHPTNEGENQWEADDQKGKKFVQEYIETAKNGGGFTYYEFPRPGQANQVESKVVFTALYPDWNWVVGAGMYEIEFNKGASLVKSITIPVMIFTIIIGSILIWFVTKRMVAPIQLVTKQLGSLAEGDLTIEDIPVKTNDEVGKLATSLNHMKKKIRILVQEIWETADIIYNHSEKLTSGVSEVKLAAEQISQTMQELAIGSERQANTTSNLSITVQKFTEQLQESSVHGDHIREISNNALSLTDEGNELMEISAKQMHKIDHIVQDSVKRVDELEQQSKEISKLITFIEDIADQTNLLALNAAIEAARAGEQGKGFAVVASEIRKLAEQVASHVKDITSIVVNLQQEFTNVKENLHSGYTEVAEGSESIEETRRKFNQIKEAAAHTVGNITLISNNLAQIASKGQEMNSALEEIASISEESAAGVEETSASAEETTTTIDQFAHSSERLAKMAEQLSELVNEFKV